MVKKAITYKKVTISVPEDLMKRFNNCRDEYKRQNMKINLSAEITAHLEKEVKRMEKELRKENPHFLHGQESLDI